ncbi:MAG TPA: DUF2625 domain-containing protein [Chitinophagales bacterium]|nr:DUF2625 domain-containing protein [Chitinophagales bacterium]
MQNLLLLLFTTIVLTTCYAQTPPKRSLEELINKQEPAWPDVKSWIATAKNKVEVLSKENSRADSALLQTQVTTRSPMGAIVYETGGILIDNGWIRILGSGNARLNRSLMDWNKGKSYTNIGEAPSFLLIADDVLGGFYAVNAGGISKEGIGKVFYFAPDNLKWEPMDMSYTDFLIFCFNGNLKKYYQDYRWTNWEKETQELDGNKGIHLYPFLWTKEGQIGVNKLSRSAVPIQELWDLYFNHSKK